MRFFLSAVVLVVALAGCAGYQPHQKLGTEQNFLMLRWNYLANQAKATCLDKGLKLNTPDMDACQEQEWVNYSQSKEGAEATYIAHQQDMRVFVQDKMQSDLLEEQQMARIRSMAPTTTNCTNIGNMISCHSY